MIVNCAIYRDGHRVVETDDLANIAEACNAGDGIAWIGLYRPTVRSSPRSRASSICTSSPSRTR